jgi:lysine 2-monooxygenase
MDLDVAVVGGGVSGAYSAWRLQETNGKTERIALFEYSGRIGGRLFTVTMPGLPNVKAEVGGMRYIKDAHPVVTSIVEHLGLATAPFPMGAPPPIGPNCNLFYLRGKHLRLHELADPEKVPYNMAWPERGLGPTQLQIQVMNNLYPNFGNLSLCEQMKVHVFGQPMYKFGFWNLLYRVLSNEGYQFMKDAGGYEANVANACAVTQLPATEYGDNTEFLTLRDGYDQLPITLVKRFEDLPGTLPGAERVYMNRRLARIELGEGEFPYTLYFESTFTEGYKTTKASEMDSAVAPELFVVRAKKVILAMPRRSLELIESTFFHHPWLRENLPSVLIQSAFKLFLAYERPWWRALGLVSGRSVTDLPVRQVYYFGTEAEQEGGKPWFNSLLMASYNDIGTVPFWKGLETGKPYIGYRPSCGGDDQLLNKAPVDLPATDQMVRIAHKQVEEVHGLPEIPLPYAAVYHSWNEDPYGGGWHEWKAGVRLDEIMCRMRKPDPHHDIFIVGEAYSYGQGWVEGALDTAESTLQEFFGLKQPSWLDMHGNTLLPNDCPGCGPIGDEHAACVPVTKNTGDLPSITPNCEDEGPVQ